MTPPPLSQKVDLVDKNRLSALGAGPLFWQWHSSGSTNEVRAPPPTRHGARRCRWTGTALFGFLPRVPGRRGRAGTVLQWAADNP